MDLHEFVPTTRFTNHATDPKVPSFRLFVARVKNLYYIYKFQSAKVPYEQVIKRDEEHAGSV